MPLRPASSVPSVVSTLVANQGDTRTTGSYLPLLDARFVRVMNPWNSRVDPAIGSIAPGVARSVARILRPRTATPTECFFWPGKGMRVCAPTSLPAVTVDLKPDRSMLVLRGSSDFYVVPKKAQNGLYSASLTIAEGFSQIIGVSMLSKSIRISALAMGMALAAALVPAVSASASTSYTPLAASDASAQQRLGFSVAQSSDGQTTVVGSIFRTEGSTNVPSVAYVYIGVTGADVLTTTEQAQLVRSETAGTTYNDGFGSSVDVSANGDTIVVGAENFASGIGTVYVFQRTGAASWEQSARLSAPTGAAGQFGYSVAISDDGTRILAGAPALSTPAQGGAAYYVLVNGTWTLKSIVAGGSTSALGGQSVALSADGTRAAVGVPQYKASGSTSFSGRVYTYSATASGLTGLATIVDPSTAHTNGGANFGSGALSFTADDNGLLVAAPFATTAAGSSVGGMAFYYRYSTAWTRSATFSLTNTSDARLGYSGAISPDGNRIILGAPYYTATAGGQEFMSQKTGSTWGNLMPVGPSGNNSSARVGISSAFGTSSRFVIGANLQNNSAGVPTGQAYLVDVS